MTRKTKLHSYPATINGKKQNILFRDLTSGETAFLKNIKNDAMRCEFAGKIALYDTKDTDINWATLMQIGQSALEYSERLLSQNILFEMYIKDLRESVENDMILTAIGYILKIIPGQSFTDLLNLTAEDIFELVVVCEKIIGHPLLDFNPEKQKPRMKLTNPDALSPEQSKNLRQQIAELNSSMGIPR
jgi:hypothetical protein